MRIEGKRIIAFITKKNSNGYEIRFADTENRKDGECNKTKFAIVPGSVRDIAGIVTNRNYAFVGFGNKYNDNVILNYVIRNLKMLESVGTKNVGEFIDKAMEKTLVDNDPEFQKQYKYANLFNSFDLQRFLFSKDQMVSLEQFVKSSDYKYADDEHDIDNIVNILDENKDRIDARLRIEELYDDDLFDAHEGVVGAKLMRDLYARKNKMKLKDFGGINRLSGAVRMNDIILPCIAFEDKDLQSFLSELKEETVNPFDAWQKNISLGTTLLSMNLAGLRMNTSPTRLVSDSDGEVFNIDVASFYPSILSAYRIKPAQVNDVFFEVFDDMLSKRIGFKKTDKECSVAMKYMLNGIIGQFMIESSWLYDPEASMKIRVNGALLMLMLIERIAKIADIICVTIDGMFVKTRKTDSYDEVKRIVDDWTSESKLNAEITKYEYAYMLSNNDYVTDSTAKGFFSYQGNNGRNGTSDIVRMAVIDNLVNGTPVETTVTGCEDTRRFLESVTSQETLEWNGVLFNSARYYCSDDQRLCKIKTSYFSEPTLTPVTDYGVTIADEIYDSKPSDIDYGHYISEANRIINKIKVQQLELF